MIFMRGLSILLFSFISKIDISCQFRLVHFRDEHVINIRFDRV